MRVVWLVIPNLLYYYSTTFQGDQGMDARQAQLQTELQAATDAFSAAACSNVRPARPPPAAALEAYPLAQGSALWAQDHRAPAVRELRSGCGGALTPVQRRRRRCVLTTQMQTAGSRCSECRGGLTYRA